MTGELAAALRQAGDGDAAGLEGRARRPRGPGRRWSRRRRSPTAAARRCWRTLVAEGGDPAAIVEREGLAQADSGELEGVVAAAIEANPDAVEQIRGGNRKAIGAIVGAVMRETQGRADGGEVNRLIMEKIGVS